MASVDITDKNFREIYEKNDIVILDFWAAWCGPCRQFAPTFEAVSEKYSDVVFGKVNTETEQGLAGHFGIRSIPTIMVIREGISIFSQPGVLGEADLNQLIGKVKELDMEEVKKSVDAEDAKNAEQN